MTSGMLRPYAAAISSRVGLGRVRFDAPLDERRPSPRVLESRPMKVTILAPAYNEEEVLEAFVDTVLPRLEAEWELLIVDDGSSDHTPEILRTLLEREGARLRVATHPRNLGLGAALATGFREAAGGVIVTLDADLSQPVQLIPTLVDGCRHADAVFASRYVAGGGMEGVPVRRAVISRVANLGLRVLFATRVRDLTTGFRAYRAETVRGLEVSARGFEAQLELTVRLVARGCRIAEVPFVLSERAAGSSKMRYGPLVPRYARTVREMLPIRWGRRAARRSPPG